MDNNNYDLTHVLSWGLGFAFVLAFVLIFGVHNSSARDPIQQSVRDHGPEHFSNRLFSVLQSHDGWKTLATHAQDWQLANLMQFADTGEDPTSIKHLQTLLRQGTVQSRGMRADEKTLAKIAHIVLDFPTT